MRRSLALAVVTALAAGGTAVHLASTADAAVTCAPAWSATQVYTNGNQAAQSGHNYTAKWWTQNESPATHSGQWDVWADNGACGGTTPRTPPRRSSST
jgi:chitinase